MSVTTTSGRCGHREVERLGPRSRLRHDFEIAFDVEQRAQRAEHHRLVFGQQDADHEGLPWSRQGHHQPRALLAVAFERAGDLSQPLAHARQPAAFGRKAAAAVVAHFELVRVAVFGQANPAARRTCVAHDVGHGLAQRVGQGAIFFGRQVGGDHGDLAA